MPAVPRADAELDSDTSIPSEASTAMSFWRADMAFIVRDAPSNVTRRRLEVGRDRVDHPVVVAEHRQHPPLVERRAGMADAEPTTSPGSSSRSARTCA